MSSNVIIYGQIIALLTLGNTIMGILYFSDEKRLHTDVAAFVSIKVIIKY